MVIAPETRDGQSDVLVPRDYNLPVQFGAVGLRGIDDQDVVIVDQRIHGIAADSQAIG